MIPRPPFWTIEDLAEVWRYPSTDPIKAMSERGDFPIEVRQLDGIDRLTVADADVQRVEGIAQDSKPLARRREETLLGLIGALAIGYSGGDEAFIDHPYTLLSDLEKCLVNHGAQMNRGDDISAKAIADGVDLLRMQGFYAPRKRAA